VNAAGGGGTGFSKRTTRFKRASWATYSIVSNKFAGLPQGDRVSATVGAESTVLDAGLVSAWDEKC